MNDAFAWSIRAAEEMKRLRAVSDEQRREIERLRETNKRLNRRCQKAESSAKFMAGFKAGCRSEVELRETREIRKLRLACQNKSSEIERLRRRRTQNASD